MIAASEISKLFLIALLILLVVVGSLTISLKCSRCGERVLEKKIKILGMEMKVWISRIPAQCQNCGEVLE